MRGGFGQLQRILALVERFEIARRTRKREGKIQLRVDSGIGTDQTDHAAADACGDVT